MKGSKKEFTRYLDSELYDVSLEAPENIIEVLRDGNDEQKVKKSASSAARKYHLTNELIKEFTSSLGSETEQCFESLSEIKNLQDEQTLNCFKDLYSKYETVPVLFLSVRNDKKAVYVWQINRKCPIFGVNSRYMTIDCKSLNQPTKNHISFLLLATITAVNNENLISANFIDDRKLMVRSQIGSSNAVIRIYYIKNFVKTARVNPFKEKVLANELYSYRILLKGHRKCLDVSLFRKKSEQKTMEKTEILNQKDLEEEKSKESCEKATEGEIPLETKTCYGLPKFFCSDQTFSERFPVSKDGLLLIDCSLLTVIAWECDSIYAKCFSLPNQFKSIFNKDGCYYIIDSLLQAYYLNLKEFPVVDLVEVETFVLPSTSTTEKYFVHKSNLSASTSQMLIASGQSAHVFCLYNRWMESLEAQALEKPKKTGTVNKFPDNMINCLSFSLKYDIVLNVCNHQLIIYKMTKNGYKKSCLFDLPVEKLSSDWYDYHWFFIGSGKRFFLCGRLKYRLSYIWKCIYVIELKLNVDCIKKSEINLILFKSLSKSTTKEYFGQVEGTHEDIVFISLDEPFYLDKTNLMYDQSISLVNPHNSNEIKNTISDDPEQKEEAQEDNEQILVKKMNKRKKNIIHPKDTRSNLEETKDALKEIRTTIGSKLTEMKQLNEKDQVSKNEIKNEGVNREKRVSKDLLDLYEDIKIEKKRIQKQNEKAKKKNNKEKYEN